MHEADWLAFLNPAIRVLANGDHATVHRERMLDILTHKKTAFNSSSSFFIWQERKEESSFKMQQLKKRFSSNVG